VEEFNPGKSKGNGFLFDDYKSEAMLEALDRALSFYKKEPSWSRLLSNALSQDFSWERSAADYYKLYIKVLNF